MSMLFRIADRTLNRPLLILPEKLAIITEVLAGRIGLDAARPDFTARDPAEVDAVSQALSISGTPGASRFVGSSIDQDKDGRSRGLPYRRTPEGVAVITITGSLVNRGAWIGASSGLTSYEGIAYQITSAAKDPKVRSIILDIESPGGEAVGAFETAAIVRKAGEEKPIFAMVNGMACSAAYAIASACKSILSSESALSGSIGVVLMHADYSRAIDKAGITPTLIHAGAHKVDGNPYEPLSKGVRSDLQAEVDKFYGLFLDTVAAGRGSRLNAKAARATEARTFIGQSAKDVGMVDDIGSFSDLLGSLSSSTGGSRANRRMTTMFTQEDLDRSKAEGKAIGLAEGKAAGVAEGKAAGLAEGIEKGKAAGLEEGRKEGAKTERERIKGIMGHADAAGREASAQHLALNSDMSVDTAAGILATLPKASSIGARQNDAVVNFGATGVDTGVTAPAAAASSIPNQKGAVAWDSIADQLNAEHARARGR